MIKSFKYKETEKILNRDYSKKFSKEINKLSFRKLKMLNRAVIGLEVLYDYK